MSNPLPFWAWKASRTPVVAPREYCGNMCGVRVPDLPAVDGGAADASLVLSWFYDRYEPSDRARIRAGWKSRGYVDVLLSWPDSRAFGQTPAQFAATCAELVDDGFLPCVMGCAKGLDPADVPLILASIQELLPLLLEDGTCPRFCLGWELSLWLSPAQVQALIDALYPTLVAAGVKFYVHFQEGYFAYQLNGLTTADFWKANVGKLTGILHQRDLTWDMPMYQARIVDCLARFAGGFNFPPDSGFGHPFDFIALEITAQPSFNGEMSEAAQNAWGRCALDTSPSHGPLGLVPVMGSGNGFDA